MFRDQFLFLLDLIFAFNKFNKQLPLIFLMVTNDTSFDVRETLGIGVIVLHRSEVRDTTAELYGSADVKDPSCGIAQDVYAR